MLDLQRSAGNHAVARAIADRRPRIGRAVLQRELNQHSAETTGESVAILRELSEGTNTGAMRAVARAIDQALAQTPRPLRVVCVAGGESFELTLSVEDAETMQTELRDRAGTLAAEAAAAPLVGGDPFTEAFNREFASVLPALRTAGRTMSGGTEAGRGDEFSTEELHELFSSSGQRALLMDFLTTNRVPDRLFNGDDAGNANAAQRIVLSAHILARGEIQAGSFTQRIHARFCGHWVELVNNYAGVARTAGRGVEHQFDPLGEAVMGAGGVRPGFVDAEGNTSYQGDRIATADGRARREEMPVDRFDTIRPGDWLYIHTGRVNHSVIFLNWLGAAQEQDGIAFREAAVANQKKPERGGTRDEWLLGSPAGKVGSRSVYPITYVMRHDAEDRPPETVADVEERDLGVTGRLGDHNERLIRRHEPINRGLLIEYLQETNTGLLDGLESSERAEPGQLLLWRETNRGADLEVLVRLNERLSTLMEGVRVSERSEADEAARADPRRAAEEAREEAERERLETELEQVDEDADRLGAALAIGERAKALRAERTRLYREDYRTLSRRIARARGAEKQELRVQRDAVAQRRAALLIEIGEVEQQRDDAVDEALVAEGDRRRRGTGTAEHRRLTARRTRIERDLAALDAEDAYRVSQAGRGFRSDAVMTPMTGKLENVRPAVPWGQLRASAPVGG